MSASLLVDMQGTLQMGLSIGVGGAGSGLIYPASGAVIGASINMGNADTACNLMLAGNEVFGSGQLRVAVQCADADVSGQYTDPTSGLAQLPSWFSSGGILILNSGALLNGTLQGALSTQGTNSGQPQSGYQIQSGFVVAGMFQRPAPGQFVRAVVLSGDFYAGPLTATFVSQYRTTGSGGGFSFLPGSGVVNV